MPTLKASDSRYFPVPPERLFELLVDFNRYSQWWPPNSKWQALEVTPKFVGSRGQCWLPRKMGTFSWEITKVDAMNKIAIQHEGLFRGPSAWVLTPEGQGTKVTFNVDLEIVPLFVRLISYVMNISKGHSEFIHACFDGMERHLGLNHGKAA